MFLHDFKLKHISKRYLYYRRLHNKIGNFIGLALIQFIGIAKTKKMNKKDKLLIELQKAKNTIHYITTELLKMNICSICS